MFRIAPVILAILASTAQAQQPILSQSELRPGFLREGTIDFTNNTTPQYSINVRKGQRIQIDLEATNFDPLLEIYRIDGKNERLFRRNDDGGDGLNSRIIFTSETDQVYKVRASGSLIASPDVSPSERPDLSYRISVLELEPLPPILTSPLTFGSLFQVDLGGTSVAVNDEGEKIARFRFSARDGQRLIAEMEPLSAAQGVQQRDSAPLSERGAVIPVLGSKPNQPLESVSMC